MQIDFIWICIPNYLNKCPKLNFLPFSGSGSKVQVVFVSADRTVSDMQSYMREAHGNWPAVPPGSVLQKYENLLSQTFLNFFILFLSDLLIDAHRGKVGGGDWKLGTLKGKLTKKTFINASPSHSNFWIIRL